MTYFDNGSLFTVTVSAREVEDFAARWPCSGLALKALTFNFEKSNGDLLYSNDARNHPDADRGAIVALAVDAESYGRKKIARRKRA